MPAVTFFTILGEGHKLDTYAKRFALNASLYPHLETESQNDLKEKLQLPEDLLDDMLMVEDSAETLKDVLEGI